MMIVVAVAVTSQSGSMGAILCFNSLFVYLLLFIIIIIKMPMSIGGSEVMMMRQTGE